MKSVPFIIILFIALFLLGISCKKDKSRETVTNECFKGRLELQDICGNYTIKVLEGDIDPSLIQASWTHPKTNVTYEKVFALGNTCDFPTSIKEGATFYFQIKNDNKEANCVQCLAYVPAPDKKLSINVSTTPCNKTN
jgi:hypothetical protein